LNMYDLVNLHSALILPVEDIKDNSKQYYS
jgi:hypothetical protein